MTKQEQIEEQKQIEKMARIIAFDLCPNRLIHANYGEKAQCYSDNNFAECAKIKNVVDKLYNAGYKKTFASDTQKAFQEGYIQGCIDSMQETAEEIISFIESKDKKCGKYSIYTKLLQELKEKYGVEVKE